MYRDILMPVYMKLTQAARDRGLPIQFHNCGRCEDFYDDMLKLGVVYTDPAQTTNDLLAAKEKYGTKLVFCGGWDWDLPEHAPQVTEEAVRQSVRDALTNTRRAAVTPSPAVLGRYGDDRAKEINRWVQEEVLSHGKTIMTNKA